MPRLAAGRGGGGGRVESGHRRPWYGMLRARSGHLAPQYPHRPQHQRQHHPHQRRDAVPGPLLSGHPGFVQRQGRHVDVDPAGRAAKNLQIQRYIAENAYVIQTYQYPLRWEIWWNYAKGYVPLAANIRSYVRTTWVKK